MEAESFALIAHDLKNALGSLEGELESLIDDPSPVLVHSAYMRCTELRRQFVQFLTVYGAKDALHARSEDESPTELLESVHRVGQVRRLSIPNAPKVALQLHADAPVYWFFDRRLVQLALDAAFHNASRFAKSVVTLGLREEDGYLVFMVDDDGPGLGAHDPSKHSTGLGTELCESVANVHRCGERQGRVELKNRPDGGGARFELWLP
jgi:signal transduction histidine kinase